MYSFLISVWFVWRFVKFLRNDFTAIGKKHETNRRIKNHQIHISIDRCFHCTQFMSICATAMWLPCNKIKTNATNQKVQAMKNSMVLRKPNKSEKKEKHNNNDRTVCVRVLVCMISDRLAKNDRSRRIKAV